MKTWLVVDVHFMCHRAFHTTQSLSWREKPTGVIFGFLKSISFLKDEFQTDNIAFCFEHQVNFRKGIFPDYKRKRITTKRTDEELRAYNDLRSQIIQLHKRYLPRIGFKNVFCQRGMESDDIMAAIAANSKDEIILITADTDLLQCLRPNVMMYSPTKKILYTEESFAGQYGIPPRKWALLKSITGCATDEIPGIKGIGEKTALKFIRGELDPNLSQYKHILSKEGKAIVRRNRTLVQLPQQGCIAPELRTDQIKKDDWLEVCGQLGMRSLAGHPPIATRKLTTRTDYA